MRLALAVVEVGLMLVPATALMGVLLRPDFGPESLGLSLLFLPVVIVLWLAVPALVVVFAFVVSPPGYRVVSACGVVFALIPSRSGLFESGNQFAIAGLVYLEAVCFVVMGRELKRWWTQRCDTEKERFDIEEALERMGGPPGRS